ncbi:MAG: V4R domain-containing protein [Candidatus Odinarchaeota archaeon]
MFSKEPEAVTVPKNMMKEFLKAEDFVTKYFDTARHLTKEGKYIIGNQRYVALPAEFITAMRERIALSGSGELADLIIYEVAKSFGQLDARDYQQRMNVTDPVEMLSAGPIQFSFRGFAHVNIFDISNPLPDESYLLVYDHLNSFEVEAPIKKGEYSTSPRCFFNAGYSAGWCEESFGIPLQAREISCKAMGDPMCRFVMAHKNHILKHITTEEIIRYKKL